MSTWEVNWPAQQTETHFSPERVLRCFSQRPHSLHGLLENALHAHPEGIALVCEDKRLSYRGARHSAPRSWYGAAING